MMPERTFELSAGNRSSSIVLPVNPKSITIPDGQKNQTIDLLNVGEILALGNSELASCSFSSFFPAVKSPFFRYADRGPWDYYNLLKSWKQSGQIVRFIIGGSFINMAAAINKLTPEIHEGDDDLYYTIELKEYRYLNVPTIQHSQVQSASGLLQRPDMSQRPPEHIVRSLDETFWYLACLYYGDGTQWKMLATANGRELAYDVKIGDRLVLPP